MKVDTGKITTETKSYGDFRNHYFAMIGTASVERTNALTQLGQGSGNIPELALRFVCIILCITVIPGMRSVANVEANSDFPMEES